ncbi:hypothetical protein SODG_006927 [Sodalis praecaptivus]
MMLKFRIMLALAVCLIVGRTMAATLSDINVANSANQSTVTLGFTQQPVYAFSRCTTLNGSWWISARAARCKGCRSISAVRM